MSPRVRHVLIIAAGVTSLAPAVWWIVGWLPSEVAADYYADYLVRPLRLPAFLEPAIGLLSVLVAGFAASELHRCGRSGELRQEWLQVVAAFSAITTLGGLTYRIVTEPVSGANIGGGLLILFAMPFTAGMLLWAGLALNMLRRPAPDRTQWTRHMD